MSATPCVLIVERNPVNLRLLNEALSEAGYETVVGIDAMALLSRLQLFSRQYDAIVVERDILGERDLRVIAALGTSGTRKPIPIIVQVASANEIDKLEHDAPGVRFFFIEKPFDDETLLAVVGNALRNTASVQRTDTERFRTACTLGLLREATFSLRTPTEAYAFAGTFAMLAKQPCKLALGLQELLMNAIEHGNLAVDRNYKARALQTNTWHAEIERMLGMAEYAHKYVRVHFSINEREMIFTIRDEGRGFSWRDYLKSIDGKEDHATVGYGITTARVWSFKELCYQGSGNEVTAIYRDDDTGTVSEKT